MHIAHKHAFLALQDAIFEPDDLAELDVIEIIAVEGDPQRWTLDQERPKRLAYRDTITRMEPVAA